MQQQFFILILNIDYKRFIEENIVSKYKDKIGKTVSGSVTRIDKQDNTYIEIGEVKGILQRKIELRWNFQSWWYLTVCKKV